MIATPPKLVFPGVKGFPLRVNVASLPRGSSASLENGVSHAVLPTPSVAAGEPSAVVAFRAVSRSSPGRFSGQSSVTTCFNERKDGTGDCFNNL